MSLILKNVCFINYENLSFSELHLKVESGKDGSLKFFDKNKFDDISIRKDDEVIDCEGKYVTKSFAIGHHHAYSALARGMPAPKKNPSNFFEVLKYIPSSIW